MSDASRQLLGPRVRAMLIALREELRPELTSANTKHRGDLLDMLMTRIAVELDGGDPGPQYWDDVRDLLGIEGEDASALSERLAQPGAGHSEAIARIAAAEDRRRTTFEDNVAEMLRTVPKEAGSSQELAIPPEVFTDYLRARFPDDQAIEATKVVTVPGGRSKGTILVDFTDASGPRQIVIRKDFGTSVTGTSVSYEYPIVRAAWDAGLMVPEPMWLEEQGGRIGERFIAFARVTGKPMGSLFASDATPGFVRNFAATLAKLHTIDLDAVGISDTIRWGREENPVRAMIDSFYERYRAGMEPIPLMDAAFAWMRGQIDDLGNARALVHGDAGLHNTMGEGDQITALLDWEFSHAGDPAEDLTYCKYLVERILPWDEFMAAYVAAGGRPISEQRMRFFTVWRTLHLSIMTGFARAVFTRGQDRDLRIATISFNTLPRQLRDLAKDLAAYTAG